MSNPSQLPASSSVYSLLPEELFSRGLSLGQLFAIVMAYRKVILITALATMVLVGFISKFVLTKAYDATATVMVDYEVNAPDANREFPSTLAASYMTTQIAYIGSAPVLGTVVDQLGWASNAGKTAGYSGPASGLRDYLMWKVLSKGLSITNPSESRFIYITYRADNAEEAAKVANAVADVYVAGQAARQREPAQQRATDYLKSVDALKTRLSTAQKALATFRQETGLVDVKVSGQMEEERLRELNNALLMAQADGRNAYVRQRQVARLARGATDADVEFSASPGMVRIREELLGAERRFDELKKTLGPNHPDYAIAESTVRELKEKLSREETGFSGGVVTNAEAAASQSSSQVADLKRRIDEQQKKLLYIRDKQDQGAQLVSELEAAEKVYGLALDNYGQIIRGAEAHFSSVSSVAPATPPARHTKPQTSVNTLLGLILGAALGVFGAFAWELGHRRIRCVEDFERAFGEAPMVVLGGGQ